MSTSILRDNAELYATFFWPIGFCRLCLQNSVNQMAPSGPVVMPVSAAPAVGTVNSSSVPSVAMRPIYRPPDSANQIAPSGPSTVSNGSAVPVENSVICAGVVAPNGTLAILGRKQFGNDHRAGGPGATQSGNWPT